MTPGAGNELQLLNLTTGEVEARVPVGVAPYLPVVVGEKVYVSNWGGDPPAKGDPPHRYVFAVHALDCDRLDVEDEATPAVVGYTMGPRTLGRALIIPVFGH